jgi:hypothetical protein
MTIPSIGAAVQQIADEHYLGTDLFSLAKLADGWRITQKLYDMERAPTREESHGH